MIMRTPARILASALLCAGIVSSPASATTIEYTDWASTSGLVDVTYTVCDDCVADNFLVSISIADPDALLTGIFIDLDPTILESAITILTPISPDIGDFANGGDVTSLPGGVNINPLYGGDGFDFAFSYDNSGPNGAVLPVTFLVAMGSLTLDDWTRVALRFQSVGIMGSESDKLLSSTIIPLPAALPIYLIALGGLCLFGRRRRGVAGAA